MRTACGVRESGVTVFARVEKGLDGSLQERDEQRAEEFGKFGWQPRACPLPEPEQPRSRARVAERSWG